MEKNEIYDIIVIGGGPAGLTAGIYGGRAGLKTVVLEGKTPGGQMALTERIDNYPGYERVNGWDLAQIMRKQAKEAGVKILSEYAVQTELKGKVKKVWTERSLLEGWTLILASGAKPRKAGFEGEEEFKGRGVSYCATCDGMFFRDKEVFVIGGGNSAVQEALYLARIAAQVTLLVRRDQLRCHQVLQKRLQECANIEIQYHTKLVKAEGRDRLSRMVWENTQTGEQSWHRPSEGFGIFVFAGQEPDTGLYKGQIQMDSAGFVISGENCHTSETGVFAAGDLRKDTMRQIVAAARDGALAAAEAEQCIIK